MGNILAADIGGTNSRFAYFRSDENHALRIVETAWLKTADFISFKQLLDQLIIDGFSLKPEDADVAVIAIAGPVENYVFSAPPFIAWSIDMSNAKDDFGFTKCYLINDFVAQAHACRSPIAQSAIEVLRGELMSDKPAIVIGAGTALGKAALIPDSSGGFIALPSEGGHTNFPFISRRECEFQEFLIKELGGVDIIANYIVSGMGLKYIHKFLTGVSSEPEEIASTFHQNSETLTWAARFYGRVCRNYALETLAHGGVYIVGGVAVKSRELLFDNAFEEEFHKSHTMSHILKKIPVFLVTNEESGLWGAGFFGLQHLT
jgi:glucokinase